MRWERVTVEGMARPLRLRVERDDGRFLVGVEVRKDGSAVGQGTEASPERRHIIDLSRVGQRERLELDRHYGELKSR